MVSYLGNISYKYSIKIFIKELHAFEAFRRNAYHRHLIIIYFKSSFQDVILYILVLSWEYLIIIYFKSSFQDGVLSWEYIL